MGRRGSRSQRSRLHTRAVRIRSNGQSVTITDRALVETSDDFLPLEEQSLRRVVRLAARILGAIGNQRM